jgi:hypothetical protein
VESSFDVIKVNTDETLIWVEAAENLLSAKNRARELVSGSSDEYLVFDRGARKLVALFSPRSEAEHFYSELESGDMPLEDNNLSLENDDLSELEPSFSYSDIN